MNVRTFAAVGLFVAVSGYPQGGGAAEAAKRDVASVPFEIRVAATLKDTQQQKESHDPGSYSNDLVEELRLLDKVTVRPWTETAPASSQAKDPAFKWPVISRYRIPSADGGYYGIDVFHEGTPRLPDFKPEATRWQRPSREESRQNVVKEDLGDTETWFRVVPAKPEAKTEVLIRLLRSKVILELVARNTSREQAEREARQHFKLFYENAVANELFEEEDYWKWRVSFSDLVLANMPRINRNLLALGALAKERAALRRRIQANLQIEADAWPLPGSLTDRLKEVVPWFFDDKNLRPFSPTLSLAAMKAERTDLANQMAVLRGKPHDTESFVEVTQCSLMEQSESLMDKIFASVEKQWKKVQAKPELLEDPILRGRLLSTSLNYEEQKRLLKLRLYDAAEWYGPEELPKLIKDLVSTARADPEVIALMQAKLLLAQAMHLENLVLLHRVRPDRDAAPDPVEQDALAMRMAADEALHRVVTQYPQNQEALALVRQQESRVLSWIAGKLQKEKECSLAAFHRFFTARGYNEAGTTSGLEWEGFKETCWVLFANPLSTVGHTLASGAPTDLFNPWGEGKDTTAGGLADETITTQQEIAGYMVGLNLIRHLNRRGLTLAEMHQIRKGELQNHLRLVTAAGTTEVSTKHADLLREDLFKTLDLPDVAALARGDMLGFWAEFHKSYYDVFDPERSWVEAIGDFFLSPSGLLTFGVGQSLTLARGSLTFRYVDRAREAAMLAQGEMRTLGSLTYDALRLEKLGDWLAGTKLRYVQELCWEDQKLLDAVWKQGSLAYGARVFGPRLLAGMTLQAELAGIADEYNIPGMRIVVNCLFYLNAHSLAHSFLATSGAKTEALLLQVTHVAGILEKNTAVVEAQIKKVDELKSLAKQLTGAPAEQQASIIKQIQELYPAPKPDEASLATTGGGAQSQGGEVPNPRPGGTVPQEGTSSTPRGGGTIGEGGTPASPGGTGTGQPPPETVPSDPNKPPATMPSEFTPHGANPAEDVVDVEEAIQRDLAAGKVQNLPKQIHALEEFLNRTKQSLAEFTEETKVVLGLLRQGKSPLRSLPSYWDQPLSATETPGHFTAQYKVYDCVPGGKLSEADQALLGNDFGQARKLYGQAARRAGLPDAAVNSGLSGEELVVVCEQRQSLAAQTEGHVAANKARQAANPLEAERMRAPISDAERQRVSQFTDIRPRDRNPKYCHVYDSQGNQLRLFFKRHLKWDPGARKYVTMTRGEIAEANLSECLPPILADGVVKKSAELGKKIELHVPAVRPAKMGVGASASEGLLSRMVAGEEAFLKTFPELLAHKKEYANQLVFRVWMGEPDGHAGNFFIGEDGRLFRIDFGAAQLHNTQRNKLVLGTQPDYYGQERRFLKESILPHVHDIAEQGATPRPGESAADLAKRFKNSQIYRWADYMDGFLTRADLNEGLEAIHAFAADREALKEYVRSGYRLSESVADESLIEQKVEETVNVLQQREEWLRKVLEERFR